ncbi:MAG: radical SAM/SPASM domain-containing protein [Candidatus Polarisedimenticolia bacterium]
MPNPLQEIKVNNWNNAVPMSALFEITFVCNHACSFCYNCPTGQKEMNTAEIFEALRKLAEFNVLYLTLTGGEPLVRKDFFDIARRARELGFAIRIYTNGYLIDQAVARRIREVVNPIEIEISIHGARPETHERLTCVPGSLQRILDGVRYLRAEGIKVNLKCPVTRNNQDEVLDMHRLAVDLGATIIFDPVITPRDDGDKEPLDAGATDDFLRKYWSDPAFAEARKEPVPMPRHDAPGEAVCGTGRSGLAIDPYGNIYPCVQWRRKVANIKELDTLREMWRSSPVLIEVRQAAVDMARKLATEAPAGSHCNFCLGVADLQTGDAMNLYPQAARNAAFRREAYDAWVSKTGKTLEDTGGILSKCSL